MEADERATTEGGESAAVEADGLEVGLEVGLVVLGVEGVEVPVEGPVGAGLKKIDGEPVGEKVSPNVDDTLRRIIKGKRSFTADIES